MSENHSLNHFYPGKTTTYYAGLWRHPVMKILYYELKSILIQKIRENYYYTTFILKPENYEISTLLHPPPPRRNLAL